MDSKQACDKLNGFNFQNRYLVGTSVQCITPRFTRCRDLYQHPANASIVLYHMPERMAKSKEDLAERQENLERLKKQHGIE